MKPLAKSVLIPLGSTAVGSAADPGIQNKIYGSRRTTLVISSEEMSSIMKIVQASDDSDMLLKEVSETMKQNETKEQKRGFLSMLLGTLGASLSGNLLRGKGIVSAGEGIVRAGYCSSIKKNLNPPHPLQILK